MKYCMQCKLQVIPCVHMELISDWLKQSECSCIIEPNPTPIWPVAWNTFSNPCFICSPLFRWIVSNLPPLPPKIQKDINVKVNALASTYKAVLPVQVGHLQPSPLFTFLPSSSSESASWMPQNGFLCHIWNLQKRILCLRLLCRVKSSKLG